MKEGSDFKVGFSLHEHRTALSNELQRLLADEGDFTSEHALIPLHLRGLNFTSKSHGISKQKSSIHKVAPIISNN